MQPTNEQTRIKQINMLIHLLTCQNEEFKYKGTCLDKHRALK